MEATQAGAAPVADARRSTSRAWRSSGVASAWEVARTMATSRSSATAPVTRAMPMVAWSPVADARRSTSQRLADGYGSGRAGRRPAVASGALPVGVLGMGNEIDREDTTEDWGIGRVRVDKGYYCLLALL